jgi:hypothetical protein
MNIKKKPAPKKTKTKAIKPAFDMSKPLTEDERRRLVIATGTQLKFLAERCYNDPGAIAYMTTIPRLVVAFAHMSNPKNKELMPREIMQCLTVWDEPKAKLQKTHHTAIGQLFMSLFPTSPSVEYMNQLSRESTASYKHPLPETLTEHPVFKGVVILRDRCLKAMAQKNKKKQTAELEKPILFLTASLHALVNYPWQAGISSLLMTLSDRSVEAFLAMKSTKEMIDGVMETQFTTIALTEALAGGALPMQVGHAHGNELQKKQQTPEMKFQSDKSMF